MRLCVVVVFVLNKNMRWNQVGMESAHGTCIPTNCVYLFELNQQSPLLQWFFEMAFVFPLFAQNIFLIVTMLIPVIHGVRSDVCIKRNSTIMNDCIDRMRQKKFRKSMQTLMMNDVHQHQLKRMIRHVQMFKTNTV